MEEKISLDGSCEVSEDKKPTRDERLSEALRKNLMRRKTVKHKAGSEGALSGKTENDNIEG